ncbi:hypothetical protein BD410DRAFT_781872, partial [Rickenella mellea]
EPSSVPGAISVIQFLLGASLWVSDSRSARSSVQVWGIGSCLMQLGSRSDMSCLRIWRCGRGGIGLWVR